MLQRGELKAVCFRAALLVALILLPYLFAAVFAGPGWHFMGHLHAVDEGNAYLAWSRQATEGAWRLNNMYTAVPDEGLFVNAFFLVVGKAAALLHVEPVVAYHLARPICGWACLVSVYLLAAFLFPDSLTRWAAFFLAALSSGVGWLVHLVRSTTGLHPLDFGDGLIQPEAITFLCIYVNPLFAASVALMCLVFVTFLIGIQRGRYQAYIVAADPLYAAKATTITASGPPIDHALTYGFVLVLALVGAGRVLRRPDSRTVFLLSWLVMGALMPFAPVQYFPFQRKMWEGYHVALCLLAAAACTNVILPRLTRTAQAELSLRGRRIGAAVVAVAVALTVPSNLFFVNLTMRNAADNNDRLVEGLMPPIYLCDDELRALHWLRDNTAREDVVFSGPFIGSYIPAVAGNRVYMGHWAETLRFQRAVAVVLGFYSRDTSPELCERILRRARASYVYYGTHERLISRPEKPGFLEASNLSRAFASGPVAIYRVKNGLHDPRS